MNKVDLLFVLDITGSMGHLIREAKEKMQSILKTLSDKHQIDLQVGLSLYKDHPSQDTTFVTATLNLSSIEEIQKNIETISVDGGGDTPEAVLDGIIDGVNDMKWRKDSRRIMFLIGDAPAHGMEEDGCCLCGKTWGEAVAIAETNRVTVYSIVLGNDRTAKENFKILSSFTGGLVIESDSAMDVVLSTLDKEFNDLNFDSKVLEMLSKNMKIEDICSMLNINRENFEHSRARIAQSIGV